MSVEAKGSNYEQDRQRKQIERSNEHTSDREARLLADSTRHLEMRAQETADEHESRLLTQRTRQQYLRSKETAGKIKERQQIDASSKVFKRAAKADAFEKSFEPNADWNKRLDDDMLRHQKLRESETEENKLQRKIKDKEYQRNKRSLETLHDKNVRKQKDIEYRYLKRIEEKEENSKKWLDIHGQKNLEPLKKHGSYFRYLLFGTPRLSFYGQSLPVFQNLEPSSDWIWLENRTSKEILMASEFQTLSKKYALLLKQFGLSKSDVVHICIGDKNHAFGILGGSWTLGCVLSISDVFIDEETLQYQVC